MEQLLLKMARQLDALDEASLMSLWEKYATLVSRFEPTRRWEEATLVFQFIQAKHWKNQLFNHQLASLSRPDATPVPNQGERHAPPADKAETADRQKPVAAPARSSAEVLQFVPRKSRKDDVSIHSRPHPSTDSAADE